jgi:hypothetical protein
MHVLSLVIGVRHSVAGEIWKGRNELLQERVQKELQMTVTDTIMCYGMGRDKTVHVNG